MTPTLRLQMQTSVIWPMRAYFRPRHLRTCMIWVPKSSWLSSACLPAIATTFSRWPWICWKHAGKIAASCAGLLLKMQPSKYHFSHIGRCSIQIVTLPYPDDPQCVVEVPGMIKVNPIPKKDKQRLKLARNIVSTRSLLAWILDECGKCHV